MVVRGHTLCISRRKDAIPHVCVDLREVASIDASENPAAYLIKLRMKHSSFKHSDEVLRTESQSDFERWKRLLSVGRDAAGVGQPTPRPCSENTHLCQWLDEDDDSATDSLDEALEGQIALHGFRPAHRFVLEPMEASIYLTIARQPTAAAVGALELEPANSGNEGVLEPASPGAGEFHQADVAVAATIGEVAVVWSDSQWVELLGLLAAFGSWEHLERYAQFRPSDSVSANPRAWWQYAARVVSSALSL